MKRIAWIIIVFCSIFVSNASSAQSSVPLQAEVFFQKTMVDGSNVVVYRKVLPNSNAGNSRAEKKSDGKIAVVYEPDFFYEFTLFVTSSNKKQKELRWKKKSAEFTREIMTYRTLDGETKTSKIGTFPPVTIFDVLAEKGNLVIVNNPGYSVQVEVITPQHQYNPNIIIPECEIFREPYGPFISSARIGGSVSKKNLQVVLVGANGKEIRYLWKGTPSAPNKWYRVPEPPKPLTEIEKRILEIKKQNEEERKAAEAKAKAYDERQAEKAKQAQQQQKSE